MTRSAESKINLFKDEIKELKAKLLATQSLAARLMREKAELEKELDKWKAASNASNH